MKIARFFSQQNLCFDAHLLQRKSILIANMLKIGHPEKTYFFFLYIRLYQVLPDKIVYIGRKKNIDEIFKIILVFIQTGQNNHKCYS